MENSTTGISWKSLRVNSMKCIRILTEINFKKFMHEKRKPVITSNFATALTETSLFLFIATISIPKLYR